MAYTPPVGTADLSLAGSYTPPVGTADLSLGATTLPERSAALAGTTAAPTGRLRSHYDPNLLSAVHQVWTAAWQGGDSQPLGVQDRLQEASPLAQSGPERWQDGPALPQGTGSVWSPSALVTAETRPAWQEGLWQGEGRTPSWQQALRLSYPGIPDHWQDAAGERDSRTSRFQVRLPLVVPAALPGWQHGAVIPHSGRDGMQDGLRLITVEIEVWQEAGLVWNATNLPKDDPPTIVPWPWGTNLHLRCPLPGTTLRIGRSPCILIAEREIPVRRTYMSTNSATLVRWPDLTPLPVIAMSVETDFDSWCWALSATLAGPEAWPLVQPNPLACEVQATINDQVWRFLLDVPSTNRSFNSDRVTLKGRSRSAWLQDPYTPSSDWSAAEAREMQQLAEAVLDNTGWSLDWQLENWVVPAGRYVSWNTPIGALIRLVNTTDDGLYSHPYLQVISAVKRWPVASWLLDGETMDLLIPESAVISLTQTPLYSPPLNGVYVSGTSHGALALVKIAGTDGALQPAEPLVNELLCDESGVAARARGLNLLSDSGAGWEMDAEVLFTPEIGLVRPGLIVSIAGVKGISRSCRIQCNWSGGGLAVRQSVGLERREVEA